MKLPRVCAVVAAAAALASPVRALTPPGQPLLDRMRAAGLKRTESLELRVPAVRGVLPGESGRRVLLVAGCDAVPEPGREAALAVAADLARTPRRHALELVLCVPGGAARESARRAAVGWLELHDSSERREVVLAALHLEVEPWRGGAPFGRLLAAEAAGRRRLPPAWLAHAALRGARAGGGRLRLADPRRPVRGQLLSRHGRLRATSGAEPFLEAGVPSLALVVGGPETGSPAVVAAIVRRLDQLAGRPRDDDVYLALGGRIWARRDLYWAGLAVWVATLVGGLPGAWRGAGGGERRRRGRRYLPGFAFRMLFLAALLAAPAATLVLLAPASLLTLARSQRPAVVRFARCLAAGPLAFYAAYWAVSLAFGRVAWWPAQPARLALVVGAVALAVWLVGRRRLAGAVPADG